MPSWRPFTGIILLVQLLFAITGLVAVSGSDSTCPRDQVDPLCQAGRALGVTVAAVFILAIWALVDVILGVC